MSENTSKTWKGNPSSFFLSDLDFEMAAERLECDIPAIKAIWDVEAGGRHFLDDGSVIRRFEPHHFPKMHWNAIRYNPTSANVRAKALARGWITDAATSVPLWRASLILSTEAMFQRAYSIDPEAALRASSWGAPQIMGFNAEAAGFKNAVDMVTHMSNGARNQLGAFVQLIEGWGLASAIRSHDWRAFARRYNGTGQIESYAAKIESAYRRHSGKKSAVVLRVGSRGAAVKKLQLALGIDADGAFGPETLNAVQSFQKVNGLSVDGMVGEKTWEALKNAQPSIEPEAQPDSYSQLSGKVEKVLGGTTVVGTVAATATQVKDIVPEGAWNLAGYGVVALAFATASIMILRWARA